MKTTFYYFYYPTLHIRLRQKEQDYDSGFNLCPLGWNSVLSASDLLSKQVEATFQFWFILCSARLGRINKMVHIRNNQKLCKFEVVKQVYWIGNNPKSESDVRCDSGSMLCRINQINVWESVEGAIWNRLDTRHDYSES